MARVDLSALDCFRDRERIGRLISYVEVNDSLMPHSIAAATGCSLEEALTLLLMLYGKYLVDGYVLVYHSAHPDFPIDRRPIGEGLPPQESYTCPVCEMTELGSSEMLFDLEFRLIKQVEFTVDS